jgi:hypothetical protein
MVELLVGMVILAVVSTAIIMAWIVLQGSFTYSARSSEQREAARDGISLLAREVRDVQPLALSSSTPAIVSAQPYSISFYTTFHDEDAASATAGVDLVQYSIPLNTSDPDRPDTRTLYRKIGDGPWRVVVSDVMNGKDGKPLFGYTYFTEAGSLTATPVDSVASGLTDRIVNIRVRLIVDLNPGKSPTEMELTTTVQPRNLRST